MKDLFIDSCVASKFARPIDPEFKALIRWLINYDANNPLDNAFLVVSNKLLKEYLASARSAYSNTSIPVIIDKLTREGRKVLISNREIEGFKLKYYSKRVCNKVLKSNNEDRDHIPVVLLSTRKYVLSFDNNFINDLTSFPGFTVRVAKRPELLPYR